MLLRAFAISLTLLISVPAADAAAFAPPAAPAVAAATAAGDTPATGDTINPFFPEERSLGDCLSSLPKPGCGSDARGGWRQTAVLGAILAGLGFIAWRIVHQSRKARAARDPR